VSRLQEENRRLAKEKSKSPASSQPVTPTKHSNLSIDNHISSIASDGQILQKLQAQIDKQRDELRKKDHELQEKSDNIDQLNIQIERLKNAGRESRRRQKLMQVQVRTLCEERADFLAQMQDQHREINNLRKRLGIAEKENEDLVKCNDEDDPQRPRFTTAELKEVLAERNELKSRINDLEEELLTHKPLPEKTGKPESPVEEDPPVQGPLPYEPDDAPFKRNQKSSESGIRKL
jgi:chromosome segregation ATPase